MKQVDKLQPVQVEVQVVLTEVVQERNPILDILLRKHTVRLHKQVSLKVRNLLAILQINTRNVLKKVRISVKAVAVLVQ